MPEGNNNVKKIAPREEATGLPHEKLTQGQQKAAEQACGLLNALADLPKKDKKDTDQCSENQSECEGLEDILVRVEKSRQNRVVLLEGGRGSGKTTLLLTLLQQWKEALLCERQDKEGWSNLIVRSSGIVPLDVLDLGSLPRSSSLILHIASLLQRVVELIEPLPGSVDHERPVSWSPQAERELESRKAWGSFLRVAALGRDGNLRARQAHIDPETYVAELEMSERDRLEVLLTFQHFIDALVKDFKWWAKRKGLFNVEPLFVIPVDDADMNPNRVFELLELVNILRHSRIAFLMTGDDELFTGTLKVHFSGTMGDAPPGKRLSLSELVELGVQEEVLRLARRFYDKVIPPHHRCHIPPLQPHERLDKLRGKNGPNTPPGNNPPGPDATEDKSDKVQPPRSDTQRLDTAVEELFNKVPEGRHALPDRMRELLDLVVWLRRSDPHGRSLDDEVLVNERLAELVDRLWTDAVNEENGLTSEEREKMCQAVTLAEGPIRQLIEGSPLKVLEPPPFTISHQSWPVRIPQPVKVELPSTATSLTARFHLEAFNLELRGFISRRDRDQREISRSLSPRLVAAWRLARSLVAETHTKSSSETIRLAGIIWDFQQRLFSADIPWPIPAWTDDNDLEKLRREWLDYLDKASALEATSQAKVADYAKGLMNCVLQVIKPGPTITTWDDIAKKIVSLASKGETGSVNHQWLSSSAILFAAPESGMEEIEAKIYLDALKTAGEESKWWSNNLKWWGQFRNERLNNVRPHANLNLIEEFRKAWPQHPWYEKVEPNDNSGTTGSGGRKTKK